MNVIRKLSCKKEFYFIYALLFILSLHSAAPKVSLAGQPCYIVWANGNAIKQTAYVLAEFLEQSPSWDANRFSTSQEIPRILWNS